MQGSVLGVPHLSTTPRAAVFSFWAQLASGTLCGTAMISPLRLYTPLLLPVRDAKSAVLMAPRW